MSAEKPLPPFIVDQLHYLLSHSPLPLKVDQIWAGCKNSLYSDHFTLSIPFCLDFIKWDFMYNAQYPLLPPDIVFSSEDEDSNPLLEIANGGENGGERKSSLRDWNSNDPPKPLALVHEIRELYLEYHRKRVAKLDDERLKFETDTIFSGMQCNSQGVTIVSPPKSEYPWSPRWEASEMTKRIFEFLVDDCSSFKKYCADLPPQ